MSWFTPEELPDNKYYLFGKEGGKRLAQDSDVELLGQIPIVEGICISGDAGTPIALKQESIVGKAFHELAQNLARQIAIRNANLEPTKIVEIKS
jgi:ATP-binding protein involved in chromosome partitioning